MTCERWIQSVQWYPIYLRPLFNIIHLSTPRAPKWPLPFGVSDWKSVCISLLSPVYSSQSNCYILVLHAEVQLRTSDISICCLEKWTKNTNSLFFPTIWKHSQLKVEKKNRILWIWIILAIAFQKSVVDCESVARKRRKFTVCVVWKVEIQAYQCFA